MKNKHSEQNRLVGEQICHYRHLANISQAKLAEKVDVSAVYISKIECGRANASTPLLFEIAEALNVSIYELYGKQVLQRSAKQLEYDWVNLLNNASPDQQDICYTVCRTLIEKMSQQEK